MTRRIRQHQAPAHVRLAHDLDVIGRMTRNDRAPASDRVAAVVGSALFEVLQRSLDGP
jgi:hypothetical protein